MADRVRKDVAFSKIVELRVKHQNPDGSCDMSVGTPFHTELRGWLESLDLALNFDVMADDLAGEYYRVHRAYQKTRKPQESLFEDSALISLSLDRAEHIEMGNARRAHLIRHSIVVTTEFARQSSAFNEKIAFIQASIAAFQNDSERLRDVIRREEGDSGNHAEAAD